MRSLLFLTTLLSTFSPIFASVTLPTPDAPHQPSWNCEFSREYARRDFGINIIPWYGVMDNMETYNDWFLAYVIIYVQSPHAENECISKSYPIRCRIPPDPENILNLPDPWYELPVSDLIGSNRTLSVRMGDACNAPTGKFTSTYPMRGWVYNLYHHFAHYVDVTVIWGDETQQVNVGDEVALAQVEKKGTCVGWIGGRRPWAGSGSVKGPFREGVICSLPLDAKGIEAKKQMGT